MPTAICPECSEDVYVDADSEQGDTISCEECNASLTVVGLDPIELDLSTGDDDPYGAVNDSDDFDSDLY